MCKQMKAMTGKMVLEMGPACVCCAKNTTEGLDHGVGRFRDAIIQIWETILPDGLSKAAEQNKADWLSKAEVVAYLNKDQYPKAPVIRPEAFLDQLKLQGICVTKKDFYHWLRRQGYAKKGPYPEGCNLATGKSLLLGLFTDNTKAPYYGLRMTPAGVAYFSKCLISIDTKEKDPQGPWS